MTSPRCYDITQVLWRQPGARLIETGQVLGIWLIMKEIIKILIL